MEVAVSNDRPQESEMPGKHATKACRYIYVWCHTTNLKAANIALMQLPGYSVNLVK